LAFATFNNFFIVRFFVNQMSGREVKILKQEKLNLLMVNLAISKMFRFCFEIFQFSTKKVLQGSKRMSLNIGV
jgi:hypothetical protein